jgi:hypothetical protein
MKITGLVRRPAGWHSSPGRHLNLKRACAMGGRGGLSVLTSIGSVTSHLIRRVSRQNHVEEFLMNQEYVSAHRYKLNLNELIIKILQN